MSERRQQIQVGILFMLAVIVLIAGVMWFKDFKIGGATYHVRVDFPSTSGLVNGDPVEVRGVVSGKVASIDYREGKAIVTLQLNKGVTLYKGTRVELQNVGIMGQKLVAVFPGPPQNPPIPEGALLHGEYQPGIPQLMAGLGGTLDTFEQFAARLDSLLAKFDEAQQGQLTRTLANTEQMTKELASLLKQHREDLSVTLSALARTTAELDTALSGRGEVLGDFIDNTAQASTRLDSTLVVLDNTAQHLDQLITRIDAGQGTAGKLVSDQALYDELVTTLDKAQALLEDLQKNPRRYFKVSLF
jgi:phospholipid/cholesterol/gamma-HCH transport system substrate-binding protein